jgi:aldose 1-epimerase
VTSSDIAYTNQPFGVTATGEPVERWTMDDGEIAVGVLNLGGIIQSLELPDAADQRADIVLGFDDVAGYEATKTFAGALIGRFANRIADGRFTLDGVEYAITPNEGTTALHGGLEGFHRRIWSIEPYSEPVGGADGGSEGSTDGTADAPGVGLRLRLVSPDGDQGFPGRLEVTVDYLLVPGQRRLKINYRATTDQPTVVNLTHHAYFNLAGSLPVGTATSPTLDGQRLQVDAAHYTPVDGRLLPSGEEAHTIGTSFDLRQPQPLDFLSLDHNLILGDGLPVPAGQPLRWAAALEHPASGRRMEVLTSEPGIQVYTGVGLDGSEVGKGGIAYQKGGGICLETQHFPDAPNHPAFPSTTLRPGEEYRSRTEWRFPRS